MDGTSNGASGTSNGVSGVNGVSSSEHKNPEPPTVGPKRKRRGGLAPAATNTTDGVTAVVDAATPAVAPVAPVGAVPEVKREIEVETKRISPHYRKIPQPDLSLDEKPGEGWEQAPSAFIYDSRSNDERPVKILCTDVRMWPGLGEVIYARSKMPVTVTLPTGELFETPPGVTIAYPACNELLEIVRLMEANPNGVVEAKFAPIGERPTDLDKRVMHYLVRARVVPGLTREDAWRGG